MLDPDQLAALAAVHRRGSFDLAAAQLGVTPSAISQRIKALEERIGTLLVVRGQPNRATDTGLRLIRHHDDVALLEAALADDLPRTADGPPVLRIAVNADSLATWFLPALAAAPGPLWDLVIDDQDWSEGWLRRGEVAAAVTGGPGQVQGCDTIALGLQRFRAAASPAFVARWFADGVNAATLSQAPALVFNDKDGLQRDWMERQTGLRLAPPLHRIASPEGFVTAALLGIGWCMNVEPLVHDHLAARRLVDIVPDTPLDVPLYWQVARLAAPALAPLTRAVRQAAAAALIPADTPRPTPPPADRPPALPRRRP
jgi:LysR family transcriptional regulator, chromosome initiation inhibitor